MFDFGVLSINLKLTCCTNQIDYCNLMSDYPIRCRVGQSERQIRNSHIFLVSLSYQRPAPISCRKIWKRSKGELLYYDIKKNSIFF